MSPTKWLHSFFGGGEVLGCGSVTRDHSSPRCCIQIIGKIEGKPFGRVKFYECMSCENDYISHEGFRPVLYPWDYSNILERLMTSVIPYLFVRPSGPMVFMRFSFYRPLHNDSYLVPTFISGKQIIRLDRSPHAELSSGRTEKFIRCIYAFLVNVNTYDLCTRLLYWSISLAESHPHHVHFES